jgi:hypothetical protein
MSSSDDRLEEPSEPQPPGEPDKRKYGWHIWMVRTALHVVIQVALYVTLNGDGPGPSCLL